jgi:hypothetical protein
LAASIRAICSLHQSFGLLVAFSITIMFMGAVIMFGWNFRFHRLSMVLLDTNLMIM